MAGVAIVCVVIAATARAMHFTDWSTALKIDTINGNSTELNTTSLDGCPIQSPDGLSLYMASNRPGGLGGLDIWVAHRASSAAPFGAPENLGEPVNSAADDFCPTPVRGKGLFLVSREALPGSCGQGDIYFTSRHPVRGWNEPQRLACAPAGPNTALDEQGPSFVDLGSRQLLYFSTSSVTPAAAGDIFVSARRRKPPLVRRLPSRASTMQLRMTFNRTSARTVSRSCSRRTGRAEPAARTSGARPAIRSVNHGRRRSTWEA
ncbi:MAG: hypothetical protein ACR2M2_07170 [Gaiellaceae bacterium]